MLSKSYVKYFSIISTVVLTLLVSGCGIFGSDEASLDGDLSYEVEGSEGDTVFLSKNSYIGTSAAFETLTTVQIPASGVVSGDLEDGNYDGYQLQASPYGDNNLSITLRLLSDGDVLGEEDTPNEHGIYVVEVGDIPDFSDFQ